MSEHERTLVIGDTHFCNPFKGYFNAQSDTVISIIHQARPSNIVFLGDIFHVRKPEPEILLQVKNFLGRICNIPGVKHIFLLRGNHDSSTKSDDGITALSLYEGIGHKVSVITHTSYYPHLNFYFIPHYECKDKILDDYRNLEKEIKYHNIEDEDKSIVFGHFGFAGCYNSSNDIDFDIDPNDLKYITFLGHIHKPSSFGLVNILGTPYSTSHNECDYLHQYAIILNDFEKTTIFHPITFGLRHLVFPYESLEVNKDFIMDSKYKTVLRVFISHFDEAEDSVTLRKKIKEEYNCLYVDIKYSAIMDKEGIQSNFNPQTTILEINDKLIEKYIDENKTSIPRENLMEGFKLINDYQIT